MLYKETVEPQTLDLILRLLQDDLLKGFDLVGGTALSLQIGHRKSIDIDLFNGSIFDATLLSEHLLKVYKAENIKTLKNGVFCFINDVKVDLLSHQYPLIKSLLTVEGIRMLSLEDIGAMKLSAIVDNGSRFKDFVDVYTILEHICMEELTEAYEAKYPDVNRFMAHKALTYHDDIIPASIEFIGREITLKEILSRLKKAIQEPKRIFESIPR